MRELAAHECRPCTDTQCDDTARFECAYTDTDGRVSAILWKCALHVPQHIVDYIMRGAR